MNRHSEGLWSVHIAVLIFGLTGLGAKLISLSALDITFFRCIFAFLAIFAYIKYLKEPFQLKQPHDYAISMLLGLFLALHWISYFHAMQISSIAIGMISLYTYPVITVFLEPFFHSEKPQVKDIFSAFIVLFGIFLLVPKFSIDNQTFQGVLWGVFSAFMFAIRNILQGRYFKNYPARHALFYQTIMVILLLVTFSYQQVENVSSYQWLQLAVLGVIFTALPHTLFAHSLLYLKAKTVSLVGCMQVVYGSVFAALILLEIPQWSTIFGGLLVISAAVYETLNSSKQLQKDISQE